MNLAADAVLERRDDLAAGGVILRVGGEGQHQIEREAHGISFDLHVAFLHDVEQAHLNLPGQVGQFIDGEDAAIGARQEAVVHGELAREIVAAARRFDRVDVADHVGDGDIGSGQLLDVAGLGGKVGDVRAVALLGDQIAAAPADGLIWIVMDLTPGDVRSGFVEQPREHANEAGLGLAAESQQDEIMA